MGNCLISDKIITTGPAAICLAAEFWYTIICLVSKLPVKPNNVHSSRLMFESLGTVAQYNLDSTPRVTLEIMYTLRYTEQPAPGSNMTKIFTTSQPNKVLMYSYGNFISLSSLLFMSICAYDYKRNIVLEINFYNLHTPDTEEIMAISKKAYEIKFMYPQWRFS